MSRVGLPGSPWARDERAPCWIPAAPVPTAGRTRAAARQPRAERRKRSSGVSHSRASPSQQPPCSESARPQPSPRSRLSLKRHQFLPASHSSPSLQRSETGSELPPGRKRRQRRDRDSSRQHGAASTPLAAPKGYPPTTSWGFPPGTPNLPPRAKSHKSTGRGTLLPDFIGQGGCAPPWGRQRSQSHRYNWTGEEDKPFSGGRSTLRRWKTQPGMRKETEGTAPPAQGCHRIRTGLPEHAKPVPKPGQAVTRLRRSWEIRGLTRDMSSQASALATPS